MGLIKEMISSISGTRKLVNDEWGSEIRGYFRVFGH